MVFLISIENAFVHGCFCELKGVFESEVAVVFCLEIHQNNIFIYFFKIISNINTSKYLKTPKNINLK